MVVLCQWSSDKWTVTILSWIKLTLLIRRYVVIWCVRCCSVFQIIDFASYEYRHNNCFFWFNCYVCIHLLVAMVDFIAGYFIHDQQEYFVPFTLIICHHIINSFVYKHFLSQAVNHPFNKYCSNCDVGFKSINVTWSAKTGTVTYFWNSCYRNITYLTTTLQLQ